MANRYAVRADTSLIRPDAFVEAQRLVYPGLPHVNGSPFFGTTGNDVQDGDDSSEAFDYSQGGNDTSFVP